MLKVSPLSGGSGFVGGNSLFAFRAAEKYGTCSGERGTNADVLPTAILLNLAILHRPAPYRCFKR
jgi:hypothetical protein